MTSTDPLLSAWETYYVIVGSSGAALIGLQFVVITLIAAIRQRTDPGSLHAFGTPNVVHLTSALVISALMSAPWPSLFPTSVALGLVGGAGLAYGAVVFRRARRQSGYVPVWEDWLWFMVLPGLAYAALALGALLLRAATTPALFLIGATALSLLLIGIHNAWDTVTHLVVGGSGGDRPAGSDRGRHRRGRGSG